MFFVQWFFLYNDIKVLKFQDYICQFNVQQIPMHVSTICDT